MSRSAAHCCGCLLRAHRTAGDIPLTLLEQRQPVDDENECLEYEIYGHFKFPHEADSVYAIGRQWVSVAHAAGQCTNWERKKDEFDNRTDALSEPFE